MTNHSPLVSCIIIYLNGERFLPEAIESVLAQNYDNWELFLVNDGSSDSSAEISQAYQSKHPDKVHYLEHENGKNCGKNASRNLGIAHARGAYIALLDADDVWLPTKLTEQVALMEKMPEAAMIYGRTEIWTSWSGKSEHKNTGHFYDLGVQADTLIQPPRLFIQLLEGWAQTPTTCNALFRRKLIDEIGNFDEDFHDIFEDQIFFAKIELAYPVFVADNTWARYRQHQDSSFAQHSASISRDRSTSYATIIKFFDWLEHYLDTLNHPNSAAREYLGKRKRSVSHKLKLVQRPVMGPVVVAILGATEWSLGMASRLGRRLLPAKTRDWLWVKVGKKVFTNL